MSPIYKGTWAMLVGITLLSVDSLLIRLIHSSEWTLLFWRGLFSVVLILSVMLTLQTKSTIAAIKKPDKFLFLGSFAFSMSTICFVLSIEMTQVASTLIIINVSPLISALLAYFFLKERVDKRTLLAIVAATAGIMFVFSDTALPDASLGNLMALITAFMLASYFVILRKTQSKNAPLYLVLGGFFTMTIALFAGAEPFSLTAQEWIYILILCVGVVPLSFVLISIGPRYLPAAHANLFMLLEAILGPLFVWWGLGEVPSQNVLIGGGIVLMTLVLFTVSAANEKRSLNKKTSTD